MIDTQLSMEPLTSTIGARVDLDPRDATDEEILAIRQALNEYGMLVFRSPGMTADEQVEFTRRFGPSHGHPVREFLTGVADDPVALVENHENKPPQADQNLHTDYSFNTVIPDLAVLRAEILPTRGGDTVWSSTIAAYEDLSDPVKRFIEPLLAVHEPGERFWFEYERALGSDYVAPARAAFPGASHPVVALHPYTNRPLLFVNAGYTTRILGLTTRESRSLLALLFDQLRDPAFHVRHRWQLGDVVMWDEHSTLHMGPHDFHPQHRRLTRVTAGHRAPVGVAASAA
jgi:taurine dioxygenase